MNLTLLSIERDVIRLAAEGAITTTDFTSDQQNPLVDVVGQHWSSSQIILSLDKATYIDSSAIGWLLTCNRESKSAGGRIVLHSIPPTVKQILDMLKIGSVLDLAANEADALTLINGEQ